MNTPEIGIALKSSGPNRNIRLFIASPSDCSEERRFIKDLSDELNAVFCSFLQVVIVPIGWEDVSPSLGEPQEVIDRAIGDYDIFIGVMWLRFGTPTSSGAQSGTEHEFNGAYELWQKTGKPAVMFYFNDQPPENMANLDISQFQRVRTFREQLQDVALTKSYKSFNEFQTLVRLDLQRVLRDVSTRTVQEHIVSESIPEVKNKIKKSHLPPLFFHSCPLPQNFIRRSAIKDLFTIIASKGTQSSPSVISVVGIAGAGKTISVRAAVDALSRKEAKVDGLLWYSFYEAKAHSSEEFLAEALNYFSQGEIDLTQELSPHQRKVLLWQYLQTGRFVIVLDGIEYLQMYEPAAKNHGQLQDRVMKDFLRGACQLKTSTVIVTSRIYLADLYGYEGYHNMALGSFSKEEARSYMSDSGVRGSSRIIDDACAFFGYHPLSLRVLTDYLVRFYKGDAAAAKRFMTLPASSPVAEKLDTLFSSYWSRLNEDQQFFLSRLSALRTGATEKDFSVLVRPIAMGGSGDPQDLGFRESVARLEVTALLEIHERDGEKFYTAPALLRMLAYDRMSSEERKKAHVEWLRYTEGIPIQHSPRSVDRLTPIIEMVYHCLKAGLYERAWELYNRKGKYNLSRQLIDWGSHEIANEISNEFWKLRSLVAGSVANSQDFMNELIAFYSTHLMLSGRIASAQMIMAEAPKHEFEVPLCIRIRCLLLTGEYKSANQMYQRSKLYSQSPYSIEWSEALLQGYSSESTNCLLSFQSAVKNGFMLVRGYLGLLYFDYITALITLNNNRDARVLIEQMESNVVTEGGASGFTSYSTFLRGEVCCLEKNIAAAEEYYKLALSKSKELGDTFLECVVILGQAKLEFIKYQQNPNVDFIGTAMNLCLKGLGLCREAGEQEVDYGFIISAGQAYAMLTRMALIRNDDSSASEYYSELGRICDRSQNYHLKLEYQSLKTDLV